MKDTNIVTTRFTRLETLLLFAYFLVELNVELFVHRALFIGVAGALICVFLVNERFCIRRSRYLLWTVLWSMNILISVLYSINQSYTITAFLTVASRGLLFVLLLERISSYNQLVSLIKLFLLAEAINLIYILSKVNVSLLGIQRLGVTTINSDAEWNANAIGFVLAYCVFALYLLIKFKQLSGIQKTLGLLGIAISAVVVVLTGSREALAIMLFLSMFYYLTSANTNTILYRIIVALFIIVICWYLIMNNEMLYNLVGVRIEHLINSILGTGDIDGSLSSRSGLIRYGLQWFKERPIAGYGMYTYMELSSKVFSFAWYAHNNYIETLVGLGIIGLCVYYWYYLYILKRAVRRNCSHWQIVLSLIVTAFIAEYGTVSFKMFIMQFSIVVCAIFIKLSDYSFQGEMQNEQ